MRFTIALFDIDGTLLRAGGAGRRALELARGGLDSFFSFGGFGSDHLERAELLRVGLRRGLRHATDAGTARAVVIGDTPHDIHAAQAIGADCIAVSTGSYDAAALEAAGAHLVVSDLRAPAVLRALS